MTLVLGSGILKGEGQERHQDGGGRHRAWVQAAAQFKHPHLVEMRPVFGDELAFEPELGGGVRLSEICRKRFGTGPVPLSFGLRILLDTMSGLAALHGSSLGFSHGEVAPCNIVIGRDGTARIIPVVASHWRGGPPADQATGYVAPEKLRGDAIDHRSDVFSLGVMLWEMITGRSFRGLPSAIITAWVIDGKVPDPVHPDDAPWVVALAHVATRALAVNPGERWPHVGMMGAEIEDVAADHIASSGEVAALLSDATEAKKSVPSAETPSPPSISPTAVSISPVPILPVTPLPPTFEQPLPVKPTPPAPALQAAAPTTRRAGRSRQSVIAWATLATALLLVGVAALQVFDVSRGAKSVPATAASFTLRQIVSSVPLPVEPPVSSAPTVAEPQVAEPQVAEPSVAPRPATKPPPARKPPRPGTKKNVKAIDPKFGI